MSSVIIMFLVIVLTLLVVLIGLHWAGFFTYTPADLPPFSDIAYAIDPSILKEAKRDYNKIIDTIFAVLNTQTALIDNNVSENNENETEKNKRLIGESKESRKEWKVKSYHIQSL